MNRIRFTLIILVMASTLLAQEAVPDVRTILRQQWTDGSWRTIQFVTETTDVPSFRPKYQIRSTVAIERPDRIRIEMEARSGSEKGGLLTIVSDGKATWIYNSHKKQYAKLPVVWQPRTLLSKVNAWTLVGTDAFGKNADLFQLLSQAPKMQKLSDLVLRQNVAMTHSETIRVGREKHDCWVVSDSESLVWIDKILWIPIRFGAWQEVRNYSEHDDYREFGYYEEFFGANFNSLRVDDLIPASIFAFTPPNGSQEVPAHLQIDNGFPYSEDGGTR